VEAERRQITVMFCDLVGSTVLSTRLDPEDLREVMGRYHAMVATIVGRFDGFVAQCSGDGVLATFGYPHAHEDDTEQAVRAGLALVAAVGELQAPERLQLRIGIASGLVVSDLTRDGSARGQTIVGETPNLAARLQTLAEPDTIVLDDSTRRQIGTRFEVRDLGPQALKGFAEPQSLWRVLAENRTLGRFETLRSGTTPLVGRDEEIELLLRRWTQAKAGRGRVVLISGDPGVGKSRLAATLAERIADQPRARLRYFCSPHHQDSALYPVISQMERAAGFAHADGPAARLAKLQALLAATAPPIEDVALIAELHALPSADIAPPLEPTPQRKKEKTFEALLRQVDGLSRQQPVLMVFDDIHWIDPSSRELLDRTIERVADWPVLLLAMFRPEFLPPWIGQPHVTTLTLTRLDRRDTAALVANVAGNASLPPEIVEGITERADGVPLFVEELTKSVLESGAQAPASLSSLPHPALSVPATLHASLIARLDRLGPAAKDVAQTSAAIGREFEYGLLAFVADLTEPELRDALDRLTNSGLLFVRGTPPEASYIFKHALVRDAAYGTSLRSRRLLLHGRIVTTLEDRFPEIVAAQPALLAQHCAAAELAEKAVAYWLKAGRHALAGSAMTEAIAQLRKGLAVLAGLPDGPWRRQQELDLQIALGAALSASKGYSAADVGESLARARTLSEQIDRPERPLPLIVRFTFHSVRAEHRLALSVGEQFEQIGKARNDAPAQLLGHRLQGVTRLFLGEFVAARALLERCVGLDDLAHRGGPSVDPYATTLTWLALTLAILGYIDQARSRMDEALSEARRLRHVHTLTQALSVANCIDWLTCSPIRHAEEALALSTEHRFPFYLGLSLAFRGRSLIVLGQAREALVPLTEGLAEWRAGGCLAYTPMLITWLAEVYAMLPRPAEELNCLAEAARIVETTDERFLEAELLYRVPGNLLKAKGDQSGAERHYRQAIAVGERQEAKLFQLRALVSLARLWRDQGKRAEARDLLSPIYNWFTEGFDTSVLKDAKALLDELA